MHPTREMGPLQQRNKMREIDPKVPKAMMVVPKAMYGALPFFDWMSNKTLGSPRTITAEVATKVIWM